MRIRPIRNELDHPQVKKRAEILKRIERLKEARELQKLMGEDYGTETTSGQSSGDAKE